MTVLTHILILFVALQALDAFLTVKVIETGGRELNPLLRWLMVKMGVIPALVAAKLMLVFAAILPMFLDAPYVPYCIATLIINLVYIYVNIRSFRNWRR